MSDYHSLIQKTFLEHLRYAQAGVGRGEGGVNVWQIPTVSGKEDQPVSRQSRVWSDKNSNKSFYKAGQRRESSANWRGRGRSRLPAGRGASFDTAGMNGHPGLQSLSERIP